MNNRGKFRYQLWPLILIPLGFILYNDALRAPFVYDDKGYILQNEAIRSLSAIDITGTRYLGFLSFALNYAVGGFTAFDYHLVNVVIHIVNAILVFFLAASIAETPLFCGSAGSAPKKESVIAVAVVASVVFLAHPLQTQAVTYVTQRFTSLATMFYLLAVLLYARARIGASTPEAAGRWRGRAVYILSLVFTLMAMKTKEISFTIPFAILIYDWVFFRGEYGPGAAARRIPYYFLLLVIPLSIILPEYFTSASGSVTDTLRTLQLKEAAGLARDVYVFTQFNVIVAYLKLLVYPAGLAIDRSYPLSTSFFEFSTVASFLFLALLLASAVVLSISRRATGVYSAMFSFGVLWFFNGLIVESFLVPIQDVFFEQRVYLPSIGFFIAAAAILLYLIDLAGRRLGTRLSSWAGAALLLVVITPPLVIGTLARNEVWTDELRLLDGAIELSPEKSRLYYARACVHAERHEYEAAALDASVALRLNPNHADAVNVRAQVLQKLGRTEEAMRDFSRAIALAPDAGSRYYNRALALEASGDYKRAIVDYSRAIIMEPGNSEAYNNRGVAYSIIGDASKALEDIKKSCSMGYATACDNLKKLEKAGAR